MRPSTCLYRQTISLLICGLVCVGWMFPAYGDEPWQVFGTNSKSSLRGLHAVNQETAWACGSKGTILRTIDGGMHWEHCGLAELAEVEIRSIHAWDAERACVATAGQPARILRTSDGGRTWKSCYEHSSPQAFFDGMRFWDNRHGVVFSDPVDGHLLIALTEDEGVSWKPVHKEFVPNILKNEGGFAASNSSLMTHGSRLAWIGTGGETGQSARVFRTDDQGKHWSVHNVEPIAANASSGIFSIDFADEQSGVAVGGDYQKASTAENNIAVTDDGGLTWRKPQGNPRGYRSCIVSLLMPQEKAEPRRVWIACGPTGCDWSVDREHWQGLAEEGFHTMFVASDHSVWAAGAQGRVAKLERTSVLSAVKSLQAK